MKLDIRPRSLLTTISELLGFGVISTGVWQLSTPAGWITAGVSLVVIGVLNA